MKTAKRVISLFLCLLLCMNLSPLGVMASVGQLAGNESSENEALLEQLTAYEETGALDEAAALLASLGLLGEDGSVKTDYTVDLNGESLTLDEVERLLEDGDTDLAAVASVDGTPIALGDLKTIIEIERALQRIEEKLNAGDTFTEEQAAAANELLAQLMNEGITMDLRGASAGSGWEIRLDKTYRLYRMLSSGNADFYPTTILGFDSSVIHSGTVSFRYTVDLGLLADYVEKLEFFVTKRAASPTGGFIGADLGDSGTENALATANYDSGSGIYSFSYTATEDTDYLIPAIRVVCKAGKSLPDNLYGTLYSCIRFYDIEGVRFNCGGATYSVPFSYLCPAVTVSEPDMTTDYWELEETCVNDMVLTSNTKELVGYILSSDVGVRTQTYEKLNRLAHAIVDARTEDQGSYGVDFVVSNSYKQVNSEGIAADFSKDDHWESGETLEVAERTLQTVKSGSTPLQYQMRLSTTSEDNTWFFNPNPPSRITMTTVTYSARLADDGTAPVGSTAHIPSGDKVALTKAAALSSIKGTYKTGDYVPVIFWFNELVRVTDSTRFVINGMTGDTECTYTPTELHMNSSGNALIGWYQVKEADTVRLTVTAVMGVTDVWDNEFAYTPEPDYFDGVYLISCNLDGAVSGLTGSYDPAAGTAAFTAALRQGDNYINKYNSYDTSGSGRKEAPYRLILKKGGTVLSGSPIQLHLTENNGVLSLCSDPIPLAQEWADYTVTAELEAYDTVEYTADTNDNLTAIGAWSVCEGVTAQAMVPALTAVTKVGVSGDSGNTTINLDAYDSAVTLTASVYPANASFRESGIWTSSDEDIAYLTVSPDNPLKAAIGLTGNKAGSVTFTFTADNGTADKADDRSASVTYVVAADTDALKLAFPANAKNVIVRDGKDVTLFWTSNLGLLLQKLGIKSSPQYGWALYCDEDGDGDFSNAAVRSTGSVDTTTLTLDAELFSHTAVYDPARGFLPNYKLVVTADLDGQKVSDEAFITVLPAPAAVVLDRPENIFITDYMQLRIHYFIENYTPGATQVELRVEKFGADGSASTVLTDPAYETSNIVLGRTVTIPAQPISDGSVLRESYQVTVTATNASGTSSVDSFPFYVYNAEALSIEGRNGSVLAYDPDYLSNTITVDNTGVVDGFTAARYGTANDQSTNMILQLRQDLGLICYAGVELKDYSWSRLNDGIKWSVSNDRLTINYKQGGLWENIDFFNIDRYTPDTTMAVSSVETVHGTLKAEHISGMEDTVEIDIRSLEDQFYLFQVSPARKTRVMYQNGETDIETGMLAWTTVYTNGDGLLALYEPKGIHSDVYFYDDSDGSVWVGTLENAKLQSGERDITKNQLYPLNTIRLSKLNQVDLYLTKPDGTPLANTDLTLRGGVFRDLDASAAINDSISSYCRGAKLYRDATFQNPLDGSKDQAFRTDETGKITVYFDPTQFWVWDYEKDLTSENVMTYVFELSGIAGDAYYPAVVRIRGGVESVTTVKNGSSNVRLEVVPAGEAHTLFLLSQSVCFSGDGFTFQNARPWNVRGSTGSVGPTYDTKYAQLTSEILLWNEQVDVTQGADMAGFDIWALYDRFDSILATASFKGYRLLAVGDNGYLPTVYDDDGNARGIANQYSYEVQFYPFSKYPIALNKLDLNKQTMTDSGWLKKATKGGLSLRLMNGGNMVEETKMPFTVIDLSDVMPVSTAAKSVSFELGQSMTLSGTNTKLTIGSEDSILTKALNGDMTGLLEKAEGAVQSPVFKVIITPTEDCTVFDACIWAGYNTLNVKDVDYDADGISTNLNFLQSDLSLGVPGVGDLQEMGAGTYDPKNTMADNKDHGKQSDVDIGFQIEGYYEGQFFFNAETDKWDFRTMGGGFTAGIGIGFSTSVNAMAGPVPLTATFGVGATLQLSFKSATVFNQDGTTTYWTADAKEKQTVNDYLTTLRIQAYVEGFGGLGFDYSVVALKIGIFGGLTIDNTNKFLTRNYLNDDPAGGRDADSQINAAGIAVSGEVGIKFVAQLLTLSYECVFVSGGFTYTHKWSADDFNYITSYWGDNHKGLMDAAGRSSGISVAYASATLQSRDYLEAYARTWNDQTLRRSAGTGSIISNLQSNANPASFPQAADDGSMLVYIDDGASSSVYDSRAFYSMSSGGSYAAGTAIPGPAGFDGYGDSSLSIAGTSAFAAASWIRMGSRVDADAGSSVTAEQQQVLINGTEIVASVWNGSSWTSARLTNNSSADMAPVVATNGSKAIVFWRSVAAASSTDIFNYDAQDCIYASIYNGSSWGTPFMVYNGSTGTVKALNAAMQADGSAIVAYNIDYDLTDGSADDYEIAYTVVDASGTVVRTVVVTCDSSADENPQIVAVSDGYVLGWYSARDNGDICLAKLSTGGISVTGFPESVASAAPGAAFSSAFRLTSTSAGRNRDCDVRILWPEKVQGSYQTQDATPESVTGVDHSVIRGVMLTDNGGKVTVSAPQDLVVMPARTLVDSFDAWTVENGVGAIVQGTWYDPVNSVTYPTVDDGGIARNVAVPREETNLYTATGTFTDHAVEVIAIGVDYEGLMAGAWTPVRFELRNTGTETLTNVRVTVGSYASDVITSLISGEERSVIAYYKTGAEIDNPGYTVSAAEKTALASGTVYMDYNDVGISSVALVSEDAGKRTVAVTLYNAAAAKLAGSGRSVTLNFALNDNFENKDIVSVDPLALSAGTSWDSATKTLTVSGNDLARIDAGAYTVNVTYDLAAYVRNTLGLSEVPAAGVMLYAQVKVVGVYGDSSDAREMPELYTSDNVGGVLLTGAYARTGEETSLSIDVEQGTVTTAKITLRNNCLQPQAEKGTLLVSLLDAGGAVLETKTALASSALSCEQSAVSTVAFTKAGARVMAQYAVPDSTEPGFAVLSYDSLGIGKNDFVDTGSGRYTYVLSSEYAAKETTVSFVANDRNAKITVTGAGGTSTFTGSGSITVDTPVSGGALTISTGGVTYSLSLGAFVVSSADIPAGTYQAMLVMYDWDGKLVQMIPVNITPGQDIILDPDTTDSWAWSSIRMFFLTKDYSPTGEVRAFR